MYVIIMYASSLAQHLDQRCTRLQSCVARQSLSNLIQQSNFKELLIQTLSYRHTKVKFNRSIEIGMTFELGLTFCNCRHHLFTALVFLQSQK